MVQSVIKIVSRAVSECFEVNKPFVGMIGGTVAIGGINGIAAAIGGNTPDIDDDVRAAIALAAFAARLYKHHQ